MVLSACVFVEALHQAQALLFHSGLALSLEQFLAHPLECRHALTMDERSANA